MSVKRKKRDPGDETAVDNETSEQSAEVDAAAGEEVPQEAATEGPCPTVAARPDVLETPEPTAAGQAAASAAKISELELALAEAKDQLLRKAADFDNFRKRMARDKEESVRYANNALVVDLIEVIDGLERAIASTEASQDFAGLHQGVVLIEKQLIENLQRKWGLERTRCAGAPFDPSFHQAISVGESVASGEQVILEEYQSGYTLHGRVVRPAKVRVSAPSRGGAPAADAAGAAGSGAQDSVTSQSASTKEQGNG